MAVNLSRKSNSSLFGQSDSQEVPGWSGLNAAVTSQVLPQQCAISYLPVIAAAPTDLSTEYVMLKRSMAVAHKLQQENVLITLHQAIYSKAQEIVCKHQNEFQNITLRMGSFHIACTLLAFIGQRFGDTGLRDLMLESSRVGQSAVNAVLHGKHYNHAVRCHKIIFERLFWLLWPLFEEWLEQHNDCARVGDADKTALLNALSQVRTENQLKPFLMSLT